MPLPVAPPSAQSRSTRSGSGLSRAMPGTASRASDQAGRSSSSAAEDGPSACARTSAVTREIFSEDLLELHRRAHVALDLELAGHVRGGRVLLARDDLLERLDRGGDRAVAAGVALVDGDAAV